MIYEWSTGVTHNLIHTFSLSVLHYFANLCYLEYSDVVNFYVKNLVWPVLSKVENVKSMNKSDFTNLIFSCFCFASYEAENAKYCEEN